MPVRVRPLDQLPSGVVTDEWFNLYVRDVYGVYSIRGASASGCCHFAAVHDYVRNLRDFYRAGERCGRRTRDPELSKLLDGNSC
jgi:hypothetical protein